MTRHQLIAYVVFFLSMVLFGGRRHIGSRA